MSDARSIPPSPARTTGAGSGEAALGAIAALHPCLVPSDAQVIAVAGHARRQSLPAAHGVTLRSGSRRRASAALWRDAERGAELLMVLPGPTGRWKGLVEAALSRAQSSALWCTGPEFAANAAEFLAGWCGLTPAEAAGAAADAQDWLWQADAGTASRK